MAGTRPDLLAALSAPDHTVQYANTTSIVHTHLCTYMGSNLLRCSRVLHNDYPRKTGVGSSISGGTVTVHPF